MSMTIRTVSILTLAALLAPLTPARAANEAPPVPSINKRGDDEKAFVKKLAVAIVTAARTTVKPENVELKKYEKKEPKAGRTDFVITATYKGVVTKKEYTADITVHVDTVNKDKWEVTRIEYADPTNKNPIGFNRKNVDNMVDKLNGK